MEYTKRISQKEIDTIRKQTQHSVSYFLHGGCLEFALLLQKEFGGKIRYLPAEEHIILEKDGYLYDARGNITTLHKNSCYFTEEEFYNRPKIVHQFQRSKSLC